MSTQPLMPDTGVSAKRNAPATLPSYPLDQRVFKEVEESHAKFALFVAWYNCRCPHITLKTTPAVAAGLASEANTDYPE